MPKTMLAGAKFFGLLYVIGSLLHMGKLVDDAEWYFATYAYLPAWLTTARYGFSWFQRVAGLLAGILTLLRLELGRKLFIWIGLFTITTVYWKHPYVAVLRHAGTMKTQYPAVFADIPLDSIALSATVGLMLSDVIFQGIVIYYFTRPYVKEAFRRS